MLKQITCIILINSLLFPQYVFADECLVDTDPACKNQPGVVDSVARPDDTKSPPTPPAPSSTAPKKQGVEDVSKRDRNVRGWADKHRAKAQLRRERDARAKRNWGTVRGKLIPSTPVTDPLARPIFPEIPFENESGKSLEESSAVRFLGTSLFLNCQRQTAKNWEDIVGTYKGEKKITTDIWPDSWWTLAKSIEQEFLKYKLTPKEMFALEERKSSKSAPATAPATAPTTAPTTAPATSAPVQDCATLPGGFDDPECTAPYPDEVSASSGIRNTDATSDDPVESAKDKIEKVKKFIIKGIARGKGRALTLKKCSALVPSTSFIDYKSSEDTLAITPKASLDRQIACRSRGAETQDYPSCRKLVNWWDGFFIGKKLMETAQKVKYQMDAKDRQEDLALDMASKNPDPLLPLKMQKAGVDDQAAVAFQNSFFLGAQYAVMQTKFSQWPSREEVVKTCQSAFSGEGEKGIKEKWADFTADAKEKMEAFAKKFKGEKTEPGKKPAPPEKPDPNFEKYRDWFKDLVSRWDVFAKKIDITDLMEGFKKEKEVVPTCPVPPMSGMMAGGRGSQMFLEQDYFPQNNTGSGESEEEEEGEGLVGQTKYKNCEQINMQNLQMDAQSQPQMPEGGMSPGGAMVGAYQDDSSSGQYPSQFRGSGVGMQQGSEMIMGGMLGQSDDPCIDVMNSGTQLILNFQSREALKMALVQTGIEALANLMKGMMLRKQSAKIQSLIDGMPVPDPTLDKLSQKEEDLIASVCQIAPQEPICADFSNRSNGFYSPNVDLTPPSAATTLARVNAEAQGASAIEKEMGAIAEKEFGEAAAFHDAAGGVGGASKTPTVTFKASEKGGAGGDIGTPAAKDAEAVAAAEKGPGGEEAATPETGYTGGSEAREYKGPGFRADQYKGGQEGGLDKIAGEYGSMGFRGPSTEGISPKEAGGLFKIISDRYEAISKDRRIEGKSEIAK